MEAAMMTTTSRAKYQVAGHAECPRRMLGSKCDSALIGERGFFTDVSRGTAFDILAFALPWHSALEY
jgi:hypothetical protein